MTEVDDIDNEFDSSSTVKKIVHFIVISTRRIPLHLQRISATSTSNAEHRKELRHIAAASCSVATWVLQAPRACFSTLLQHVCNSTFLYGSVRCSKPNIYQAERTKACHFPHFETGNIFFNYPNVFPKLNNLLSTQYYDVVYQTFTKGSWNWNPSPTVLLFQSLIAVLEHCWYHCWKYSNSK